MSSNIDPNMFNKFIVADEDDEGVTRNQFMELLKQNDSCVLIFKFGATWCQPCKMIKPLIQKLIEKYSHEKLILMDIDVDESFDLFAFLKTKKMVSGVPTLLGYFPDNDHYAPNCSISGTNPSLIETFFKQCHDKCL